LIIPGYDQVLLAPVAAIALGHYVPQWLGTAGARPAVAVAGGLVVCVLALTLIGPSRERWMLTGTYRLLPGDFGVRNQNHLV
jgi:hypothetical protein